MKAGLVIKEDFFAAISSLPNPEAGEMFKALIQLAQGGEPKELSPLVKFGFDLIAPSVRQAVATYRSRAEASARNGKLGGRGHKRTIELSAEEPALPSGNLEETYRFIPKPTETYREPIVTYSEPTETYREPMATQEKAIEGKGREENGKEESVVAVAPSPSCEVSALPGITKPVKAKKRAAVTLPSSVEEVWSYIQSKGSSCEAVNALSHQEAERFFFYWDSKGWSDKSGPIKNWKSRLATWGLRNNSYAGNKKPCCGNNKASVSDGIDWDTVL